MHFLHLVHRGLGAWIWIIFHQCSLTQVTLPPSSCPRYRFRHILQGRKATGAKSLCAVWHICSVQSSSHSKEEKPVQNRNAGRSMSKCSFSYHPQLHVDIAWRHEVNHDHPLRVALTLTPWKRRRPYENGAQVIRGAVTATILAPLLTIKTSYGLLWWPLLVSRGTKICSVRRDSWSDGPESRLLPVQLPSHNISRELQLDWAKSGVMWRHLWVTNSAGV